MENYSKYYDQLNSLQKQAVDTTEGPLLILAGPGTGKTQLLSVRAGAIIKSKKASPENILILTYTNAAAKAMKERLAKVIGHAGYDVEACTFHSFANSIIQESEEAANYIADRIQMDDVEKMKAMEYILDNTKGLEDVRPFRAPYTYLKEMLQKISELKKDGITPKGLANYLKVNSKSMFLEEKYVKRLEALSVAYGRYEELKAGKDPEVFDERGRYDFDDMILVATEALKKEKLLRGGYQNRYLYVMVDEFQDTNGAQMELLFTLLGYKKSNLLCVGDDDQSIYRFQGASVGNFKLLAKQFPELRTISLKENYRSTKELIGLSGKIIELIPTKERYSEKTLKSVNDYANKEIIFREFTAVEEELLYIIDKVKEIKDCIVKDKGLSEEERKHPYNNIAVLVRKRNDILKVIDAFLQAGIPYATDGKEDISQEKRVRQLLDVLELAYINPKDIADKDLMLYKVLSSDYFGIPQTDILRFISHVNILKQKDPSGGISLLGEFLSCCPGDDNELKLEGSEALARAALAIRALLKDARTMPVHAMLLDYIKDSGIYKYVLNEYSDNNILRIRELRALGSFVNMIKASDVVDPAIGLDDFMSELKTRKDHGLAIQGNLVTLSQEGVRVYTAHGSKGLEFNTVIIPFCLHNKNWPARQVHEKIQLPSDIFKTKERVEEKELYKQLLLQDETRLFYVAMTRAKSNLIFTASPAGDAISTLYLRDLDIAKDSPEIVNEEEIIERSLDTTDLKDPFIGTEAVLKDMISNLTLNPTRLNNYITCRRKFLYNDILKLPGKKKKSLAFGNCVHKALECTYQEYKETKEFPSFAYFHNAFQEELKFQGLDKVSEKYLIDKMKTVKAWFEKQAANAVLPISLEKKLVITIGDNIIFTGKYDKVEWDDQSSSKVKVIDYKTGKPDDHIKNVDVASDLASSDCDGYLRQLVSYKLLFDRDKKESKGREVSSGELVFIEPLTIDVRRKGYKKGDYVSLRVEITEEMTENLEELIKDVWKDINQLRFEKLASSEERACATCDFNSICWE